MKYLLDTNTLIYAFRGVGEVRARVDSTSDADMRLCAINLFELEFGFAKSRDPRPQRALLDQLVQRLGVLPLDSAGAEAAGRIKAYLQQAGTPIGPYDLLIAGIAMAHNLIVVTRNVNEFARVPGLRVENWYH
ncbi:MULTISPECIES: type II toxin-antitoxin system VapC family toxin [unclassified Variovorax]|uniref:type II toxin-antitoxin system VapC family toxin n=1 Tax=unclassified Variovorax TaxID=663243 RepID=UPI002576C969|nr:MULTISPECIES: type II toxin-antitoxin system VapC family toxin [unclassified Variovorax]MDM0086192.1 type II toxin-antitoxin system VapC family toxin [Variovorax sp. J22G40]MDM0145551.1 type II toxin-antitoxin system VapC family toxin [Variovorax sp. J2P1-31]